MPHHLVGERLELHATSTLIKPYIRQRCIATHPRRDGYGFTTCPAHMPERHRAQKQWSPQRLKRWAADLGPEVLIRVTGQLERRAGNGVSLPSGVTPRATASRPARRELTSAANTALQPLIRARHSLRAAPCPGSAG